MLDWACAFDPTYISSYYYHFFQFPCLASSVAYLLLSRHKSEKSKVVQKQSRQNILSPAIVERQGTKVSAGLTYLSVTFAFY